MKISIGITHLMAVLLVVKALLILQTDGTGCCILIGIAFTLSTLARIEGKLK